MKLKIYIPKEEDISAGGIVKHIKDIFSFISRKNFADILNGEVVEIEVPDELYEDDYEELDGYIVRIKEEMNMCKEQEIKQLNSKRMAILVAMELSRPTLSDVFRPDEEVHEKDESYRKCKEEIEKIDKEIDTLEQSGVDE